MLTVGALGVATNVIERNGFITIHWDKVHQSITANPTFAQFDKNKDGRLQSSELKVPPPHTPYPEAPADLNLQPRSTNPTANSIPRHRLSTHRSAGRARWRDQLKEAARASGGCGMARRLIASSLPRSAAGHAQHHPAAHRPGPPQQPPKRRRRRRRLRRRRPRGLQPRLIRTPAPARGPHEPVRLGRARWPHGGPRPGPAPGSRARPVPQPGMCAVPILAGTAGTRRPGGRAASPRALPAAARPPPPARDSRARPSRATRGALSESAELATAPQAGRAPPLRLRWPRRRARARAPAWRARMGGPEGLCCTPQEKSAVAQAATPASDVPSEA